MASQRWIRFLLMLVASLCAAATAFAADGEYRSARAPREWLFPQDHGRHDGFKTEWWYFTGNLRDDAGRRFGFQLTFFRSALTASRIARTSPWAMTDVYFAHAAITDVEGKTFDFAERLSRGRPGLAWASDKSLDVAIGDWSAKLDGEAIRLIASDEKLSFDLRCTSQRAPVLQGPGGLSPKGREPGQASFYYSLTRLQTAGQLIVHGKRFTVTGLSWMDHEFSSNVLSKRQTGWDWLSLQLDDGRDVMVFRLRDGAGQTDFAAATIVGADGAVRYIPADRVRLTPSDLWMSRASGGKYPQSWDVSAGDVVGLQIRSVLPVQELTISRSGDMSYYEGAVDVLNSTGKRVGQGYLEMTGYAKPLDGGF